MKAPSDRRLEGEAEGARLCVICGHGGRGPSSLHHFTHGVTAWLCPTHGGPEFLSLRLGLEFVERIGAVWEAAGAFTRRRQRALAAHIRGVHNAHVDRDQPGSYSWPALRREAERRFAAGEPPAEVIAELRRAYGDGPATVPSVRTMRRWFSQARWRPVVPKRESRRTRIPIPRLAPDSPWRQFIRDALTGWLHASDELLDLISPPLRGP